MTQWMKRLIFFMRLSDLTTAERQALRRAFSNFGSGQTEADEDKMFDNPAKFSVSGTAPAQVIAINTLAKPAMLTALKNRVDVLPQILWYIMDNRTGTRGQLLNTNDADVTERGQQWHWSDAKARVFELRDLQQIVPEI